MNVLDFPALEMDAIPSMIGRSVTAIPGGKQKRMFRSTQTQRGDQT